jgi:hypothetical protein
MMGIEARGEVGACEMGIKGKSDGVRGADGYRGEGERAGGGHQDARAVVPWR